MAAKVRKNDLVQVLTGRDRGKQGKVMRVLPKENRVVVEGINMRIRHQKARQAGEQGGRVEFPAPLHISNVALVSPTTGKPARVGFKTLADGTKVRVDRKTGEVIDNG